jgi:hypothetical protein
MAKGEQQTREEPIEMGNERWLARVSRVLRALITTVRQVLALVPGKGNASSAHIAVTRKPRAPSPSWQTPDRP